MGSRVRIGWRVLLVLALAMSLLGSVPALAVNPKPYPFLPPGGSISVTVADGQTLTLRLSEDVGVLTVEGLGSVPSVSHVALYNMDYATLGFKVTDPVAGPLVPQTPGVVGGSVQFAAGFSTYLYNGGTLTYFGNFPYGLYMLDLGQKDWPGPGAWTTRNNAYFYMGVDTTPACETLGVTLPAALQSIHTQGGVPNYVDTFVAPYVVTESGPVVSWKAQFVGGLFAGQPGVPSGVQLKVLRPDSVNPNLLHVVAAGAVHDPRTTLQARFSGYPFFADGEPDTVIEFSDPGLNVMPGDRFGLSISSDPSVGSYYYPLVGPSPSRLVLRDAAVGEVIDLGDPFTGKPPYSPALEVRVGVCDTTPPVITVPPDVVLPADATGTATYVPEATATDNAPGPISVTCDPDGPTFPIGVTSVTCTATDVAGNQGSASHYVVVYDPNGGFVTGGGWIDSPKGAYAADRSLTGKASFGFVSKYQKGATAPTGQTEFQFRVANLNFHSSNYEWLVVSQAGTNAQFKGSGTINGEGTYKFMLWAGDGAPDTFRIRIWSETDSGVETDAYDNGFDQAIGGGSIVIHRK